MAGSSLLTLIDDISTLLDDVATMSKVALKKTAGVVGDDLALNAQQLVGIHVDRELPVVWAVAKGSIVNKLILVPVAILISTLTPWLVLPLLMVGGAFLCYEGVEKILHKWLHRSHGDSEAHGQSPVDAAQTKGGPVDLAGLEKERIRGAIRTDFILSAEIIVIALEPVAKHPFLQRVGVLTAIAAVMTIGVYGLVAVIIKLDDLGMYLTVRSGSSASRSLGRAILTLAPYLMKGLSIAGTIAMFMVGGGILAHGVPAVHHTIEHLAESTSSLALGPLWSFLTSSSLNALVGVLTGAAVFGVVVVAKKVFQSSASVVS